MIRTLLDANVLASGILAVGISRSIPGELIRRWRANDLTIVTSHHILLEVERTFAKPYFIARVSAADLNESVQLLRRRAELTPITVAVHGVATHPEDDLVIATAVSAKAPYLVNGDNALQQLGRYRGVTILSPARFVAVLTATI